jgi:MFS family permease
LRAVLDVLSNERRARWFLLACLQSAVGTGAATVALVVLAYERLQSPWAITLVLLAEWLPSMVAGPLLGAMVDRWSRRACAIVADLLSAVAFIALALVDSFAATVALALVAGIGISLWSPAILAALPSLVAPERQSAVTSLFGATRDAGRTIGPLVAAALFPLVGVETVMVVNGVTFAISAAAMALISFGERPGEAAPGGWRRLLAEARDGLVLSWRLPGVAVILWSSTAIIFTVAMVNVGELLLARDVGAGASGYAMLVVAWGVGFAFGSLLGASGGPLHVMKWRYATGAAVLGASVAAAAAVHAFGVMIGVFVVMGVGNGLFVVYERLIIHAAVPANLHGRAFAVLDMLTGWGYAAAFILAGGLIGALGTRPTLFLAGTATVIVSAFAALALRRVWVPSPAEPEATRQSA